MKFSKHSVCIAVISVVCLVAIVFLCYVLNDRKRDAVYFPDMDYRTLPNYIVRLPEISDPLNGEGLTSKDGFKGNIYYSCSVSSAEAIKGEFAENLWNPNDGTHYAFPDDSYEIYVHSARYMPIVRAWGHNWMHRNGNLYEKINGKGSAEDLPNFRNYFRFTIRKEDTMYYFSVFCNTDDPNVALTQAIEYLNSKIYY